MGGIKQMMYTPSNKQLVSFSNDKTVRVWDTVTGGEIKSFVITDQIVGKEEMTKDGEILTLTDGYKVIFLDTNRLETKVSVVKTEMSETNLLFQIERHVITKVRMSVTDDVRN